MKLSNKIKETNTVEELQVLWEKTGVADKDLRQRIKELGDQIRIDTEVLKMLKQQQKEIQAVGNVKEEFYKRLGELQQHLLGMENDDA